MRAQASILSVILLVAVVVGAVILTNSWVIDLLSSIFTQQPQSTFFVIPVQTLTAFVKDGNTCVLATNPNPEPVDVNEVTIYVRKDGVVVGAYTPTSPDCGDKLSPERTCTLCVPFTPTGESYEVGTSGSTSAVVTGVQIDTSTFFSTAPWIVRIPGVLEVQAVSYVPPYIYAVANGNTDYNAVITQLDTNSQVVRMVKYIPFGAYTRVASPSDNVLVVGGISGQPPAPPAPALVAFDRNLSVLWAIELNVSNMEWVSDTLRLQGKILATPSPFSFSTPADIYIAEVDSNGNVLNIVEINVSGIASDSPLIELLPDNNLVVVAGADQGIMVLKLTQSYSIIWAKYLELNFSNPVAVNIASTSAGDILLSVNGGNDVNSRVFVNISSTGTLQFVKRVLPTGGYGFASFILEHPQGYLLGFDVNYNGDYNVAVALLSSSGTVLSAQTYGYGSQTSESACIWDCVVSRPYKLPDGSVLAPFGTVPGSISSTNNYPSPGEVNGMVMRLPAGFPDENMPCGFDITGFVAQNLQDITADVNVVDVTGSVTVTFLTEGVDYNVVPIQIQEIPYTQPVEKVC